jgi:hypothetical protein
MQEQEIHEEARIGALKRWKLWIPIAAAAVSGTTVLATPLGAEVSQGDGVRVSVAGSIVPTKLPRRGSAPVAVSVSGRVTATRPGFLPKLKSISIALNSNGRIRSGGVPVCRLGHIDPSNTTEALRACGPSLIGTGTFSADLRIPEQSPFPSTGKVLAFNGRLRGQPAIFAHIYGTQPVPTSYVLPFRIEKSKGTFGTVLRASLPQVTGEWGYVTGLSINLERGYMVAGCPAPRGVSVAPYPLMRTQFSFENGVTLTSTLNRSCKVGGV